MHTVLAVYVVVFIFTAAVIVVLKSRQYYLVYKSKIGF